MCVRKKRHLGGTSFSFQKSTTIGVPGMCSPFILKDDHRLIY